MKKSELKNLIKEELVKEQVETLSGKAGQTLIDEVKKHKKIETLKKLALSIYNDVNDKYDVSGMGLKADIDKKKMNTIIQAIKVQIGRKIRGK